MVGRIVNELIHLRIGLRKSYKYTQIISEITLYIVTTISSVLILYYKNIAIFIIMVYLWCIVYRNKKQINAKEKMYNAIERYESMQSDNIQCSWKI